MAQHQIAPVTYTVDADNIIIDVNAEWDRFATNNDADNLLEALVVGQPLMTHVTGETTRMFVDIMFQSARVRQTIVTKPYRCDSPDMKRFLEMRIIPLDNQALKLEHQIVSLQTVVQPVQFVGHNAETDGRIKRCSMCNKVEMNHEWHDPLDASVAQSFLDPGSVKVYYGVCDPCQSAAAN